MEQIAFKRAKRWIGRKETDDQGVAVREAHGTMTEAEVGFAHGGNATAGGLKHLQGAFPRGSETVTVGEKHCAAERSLGDGRDLAEIVQQHVSGDLTEGLA